jgi:hypothetical protein
MQRFAGNSYRGRRIPLDETVNSIYETGDSIGRDSEFRVISMWIRKEMFERCRNFLNNAALVL